MARTVILRSKRGRRSNRVRAVQHVGLGLMLVVAGVETVQQMPWLGLFELLSGGLFLLAFVREVRSGHRESLFGIPWIDLLAGSALLAEGLRLASAGKRGLPVAYGAAGVLTIVGAYIARRRALGQQLVLNNKGFAIRFRGTHIHLMWKAVSKFSAQDKELEFVSTSAETFRLDLADIDNKKEMISALDHYVSKFVPSARRRERL